VHRDIKPGNLFWTSRPDGSALVKVLDFGVVKGPEEINFSLTQTSNVVGSPGYMSPEQLKSSKTVDFRSDIWSLGVVLYELVSARKPFHGESITELALRVAMDPVPPLAGGIPGSFESVILRCLEKEPQRRFKDVGDLAQSLAPFVGPTRGAELAYAVQRVLRGALVPPTATPPAGLPSTPTTLRGANAVVAGSGIRNKRSIRLPMIMAAGAVVGVGIALITLSSGNKDNKPAAASAPAETTKMDVAPAAPPPAPEPAKPAVVEKKPAENKPEPAENKPEPAVEKVAKPTEQAKIVEVTKPADDKKSSKRRSSKKTAKITTKTTPPTAEPTEGLSDSRK
jgi:serine/threonine-protein kinase